MSDSREKTYIAALPTDAQVLTGLVRRAKGHWGYPQQWMNEWMDELTISPNYIHSNRVIMLRLEQEVVGFFGLECNNKFAYLGHLWIEPSHIGFGLGKMLFHKVCADALALGYSTMELVADPNAEGFYRHQGAIKIGEARGSILGTERILPKMKIDLEKVIVSKNDF